MRSFNISGYLKKDENGYYTTKTFEGDDRIEKSYVNDDLMETLEFLVNKDLDLKIHIDVTEPIDYDSMKAGYNLKKYRYITEINEEGKLKYIPQIYLGYRNKDIDKWVYIEDVKTEMGAWNMEPKNIQVKRVQFDTEKEVIKYLKKQK